MKKELQSAKAKGNKPDVNIDKIYSAFAEDDAYNYFYDSVSVFFRVVSFLLFAILLIFVVSSAFVSAESFSYKNLDFIMRNFALTLEENRDSTRQPIRYNPDSERSYALFGQGLAVCGSSGLSVFSATGRQTCSEFLSYQKPILRASDKYILVYDEGSGNYSVFNSFSKVHSAKTDKPIKNAVIADNGYYALVTSSDEYNSVVEIYNNNFNIINRFNKNDYVASVAISEDKILIVTVSSDYTEEKFDLEISFAEIGAESVTHELQIASGFPLDCGFTDYGYSLVCTDAAYFFADDGTMYGEYSYGDNDLYDFELSDTHALIVFESDRFNIEYNAVCLDKFGNPEYMHSSSDTIFDIELVGSSAFILKEDRITCIGDGGEDEIDIDSAYFGCKLLSFDSRSVYFCSETFSELISCTEND